MAVMREIVEFMSSQFAIPETPFQIGQILVRSDRTLRHIADAELESGLERFTQPEDARQIALYDDAGKYRPLKTAPNLRRGWVLELQSEEQVRLALDFLYPAALGTWAYFVKNDVQPVSLREMFARQTGMYRIVNKITNEQVEQLVCSFCNNESGCLRRILWKIDDNNPAPWTVEPDTLQHQRERENSLPILCVEACNLLVAEARKVVKGQAS